MLRQTTYLVGGSLISYEYSGNFVLVVADHIETMANRYVQRRAMGPMKARELVEQCSCFLLHSR
jgi:hypothetical protein